MLFRKKKAVPRQDWKPHWTLGLLHKIWMVLFTAFKIAVGAASTVLLILVVCMFVFVGILGDYLQEDILPISAMENILDDYDHEQNSYMYYVDSHGDIQLYQNIYAETSSKWAEYEDIPEDLIHAAVAIEDHRFYEHQGVDWITTVKATARMFFGDSSAGGSSITQQLIKNVLLPEEELANEITVQRKVLEIFRAIQLERSYDKQTIMEMYLNVIYLGQNCRGVRAAAEQYYGKELEKLTLAECASIISITNNPSLFDPYSDNVFTYAGEERDGMGRNKYRQELVLGAMLEYEWITQEEYDEAMAQELVLKSGIDPEDIMTTCNNPDCSYEDILSTYYEDGGDYICPACGSDANVEENASKAYYSWYAETVFEDVAKALAEQDGVAWNEATEQLYKQKIQRGGYHIFTCLDMEVQKQLDSIYTDRSKIPSVRGGQELQSAMVIIDNKTGDIVALVGGVGEKEGFDNWNRALAKRQSGSSIKPLSVYAPAFEAGVITPATVVSDMPISYEGGCYPLNDNRTYQFSRTIYAGVTRSVNAVAANTLDMAGISYCYDFAKNKFRLSTLVDSYVDYYGTEHSDMAVGPLAMGAQTWGVTVRDMATAFATFANDGVYREARTFTKVYDSDGKLVLDNVQQQEQILSEKTVNSMNYCLVNATANGTGTEAKISNITTAGKTGTTDSNKDRWYCGFTGYYTAAVWCGFDSPAKIRPKSVNNPSAVLFKKVLNPLHSGRDSLSLYSTRDMVKVSVCLDSGGYATDACGADIRELSRTASAYLYPEDRNFKECNKHVLVDYCSGGGVATDYCKLFAEVDSSVKLSSVGLLKMTQEELEELLRPGKYLKSDFKQNNYLYMIDDEGNDVTFNGFDGGLKQWQDAPYMICPVHTAASWEEYQFQLQQPTEPEEPTDFPETDPVE